MSPYLIPTMLRIAACQDLAEHFLGKQHSAEQLHFLTERIYEAATAAMNDLPGLTESVGIPAFKSDEHSDFAKEFIRTHEQFLKLRAVIERTGLKKTQIYTNPTFPRPIKLTSVASAWLASEVDAWMDERVRAARASEVQR